MNASADSEEGRGGHKASFVSVLAAALAAAIKKSLEEDGWTMAWRGECPGMTFKRCLCLSLQSTVF